MGQQQLLLLVLSTVIVGLATVAGIQAFSENQQQATQDALVQRAITLGNEVLAAHKEPNQLGGITIGSDGSDDSAIADALGLQGATGIDADGAGATAECQITNGSSATVSCGEDGHNGGTVNVDVTVNPNTDEVTVSTINVGS